MLLEEEQSTVTTQWTYPSTVADTTTHRPLPIVEQPQSVAKRLLDISISLFLLLVSAPLAFVIMAAIKLDSRGAVIFRQERVGKGGKPFVCLKFRSMCAEAEQMKSVLLSWNEVDGPVFKMREDPRVTRVGRIIRRWSIDELPQLINVLKGEMSLVGPRPALPDEVRTYTAKQMRRLSVLPGITGLQQTSGRSELDFGQWIDFDLHYVNHNSLATDVKILLQTIPVVFSGRGAY
jgi:exopolysaccharide biosynthesis polyprenyl glycosylphosphotransferase